MSSKRIAIRAEPSTEQQEIGDSAAAAHFRDDFRDASKVVEIPVSGPLDANTAGVDEAGMVTLEPADVSVSGPLDANTAGVDEAGMVTLEPSVFSVSGPLDANTATTAGGVTDAADTLEHDAVEQVTTVAKRRRRTVGDGSEERCIKKHVRVRISYANCLVIFRSLSSSHMDGWIDG